MKALKAEPQVVRFRDGRIPNANTRASNGTGDRPEKPTPQRLAGEDRPGTILPLRIFESGGRICAKDPGTGFGPHSHDEAMMSLLRHSSQRFSRRSRFMLPELRDNLPRVSRRIHLIAPPPQYDER
jgi:hypothetical protein